jgi:hypothetical protein
MSGVRRYRRTGPVESPDGQRWELDVPPGEEPVLCGRSGEPVDIVERDGKFECGRCGAHLGFEFESACKVVKYIHKKTGDRD